MMGAEFFHWMATDTPEATDLVPRLRELDVEDNNGTGYKNGQVYFF